jgi:hypothetical protein
MADRQADGSRLPERAPQTRRRTPDILAVGASRPPCSVAERDLADVVRRRLRRIGMRPVIERVRAPTSPTWVPLLRTLFRVWAAAFLAAGWPEATIGLAAAAIAGGLPGVAAVLRFVPLLGSRSCNTVAVRRGRDRNARPIVVAAHLDTHPTAGAPMRRGHTVLAWLSALAALVAAVFGSGVGSTWRVVAAIVAAESVATLGWLAAGELATQKEPPDDNTSGILGILRTAELVCDGQPLRDVWIVATGAGTSGSFGMTTFLRSHRELRKAWVIDVDALGTGEVVAAPYGARFPFPGTPAALVRAMVAAARESGDPLTVRRLYRPHSDAKAALGQRTGAITLTGGFPPTSGAKGPDPANAERAARVIDRLARRPD